MRKLILLLLPFIMVGKSMAIGADTVAHEVLLANAKSVGTDMYLNCIVIIPATDDQRAACDTRRESYKVALHALNAPNLSLVLTSDPSKYANSPWDVCRYEVSHTVFDTDTSRFVPYCPASRL